MSLGQGRLLALLGLLALLFALTVSPGLGCADGGLAEDLGSSEEPLRTSGQEQGQAPLRCDSLPRAYVFEHEGQRGHELLRAAGFDVMDLPLDRSPRGLRGLLYLGTNAVELDAYPRYMERYAEDLYHFVDRGNVLFQGPQPVDLEPTPPFLPTTHGARRGAQAASAAHITATHPLLEASALQQLDLSAWTALWSNAAPFARQAGFSVLLAADQKAEGPLLMEGAYGQGRILLSALPFGAPELSSQPHLFARFEQPFFDNLRTHVVNVCERHTPALEITHQGQDFWVGEGEFSLAVLPDTQVYALRYPGLFQSQTAWIASRASDLNIRYAIHLGDITNNNTRQEWQRAQSAMALLDGHVPYALVPGNHDYGPSGDASSRDTYLNEFFSYDAAAAVPSFGGGYREGELDNTYHLFSAGGQDYILVALEWGPRDDVIAWANAVMTRHPDRLGIFVTHAYLNHNDRRYDHTDSRFSQDYNPHQYRTPGVNDGEQLWQKLVRRHRFVLTLNGHVLGDGTGYLASQTDTGNTCHQILANYQMRELGGEGYLRLMIFRNDGTVDVHSYSTLYDRQLEQADQRFSFRLDLP